MRVMLKRWGNSTGLRLPQDLLRQCGLGPDQAVELIVVEGGILIEPVEPAVDDTEEPDLDALVERITPENRHEAVETGEPVGKESL